jgi:hypothetical protein
MATAPPPGKAPVKGKAGKGLGKKVGPFSLWVYLVAIGGGVAVWYFFLRGKGGDSGGYGGPEVVSGSTGSVSPQDMAGAGAPSQNAAPSEQLDPATLDALSQQIGDVRGHVTELEDAFSGGGYTLNEDKTWSAPGGAVEGWEPWLGIGGGEPIEGGPNVAGTPGKSAGVKWGGNTYTTRAGIARELSAHGVNYGDWAKKHPQAAKSLAGPVPTRAPKKAAGKPGKTKTTQRHPAAAAHPAAHPGASRNVHPVAKKTPPKPAPKPAPRKPAPKRPTARGPARGRR